MFDLVLPSFARRCMLMMLGMAMEARIPMITSTIISSTSVNPCSRLVGDTWFLARTRGGLPADLEDGEVPAARGLCAPAPGALELLTARQLERERRRLAVRVDHIGQRQRIRIRHQARLVRRGHQRTGRGERLVLERDVDALRV